MLSSLLPGPANPTQRSKAVREDGAPEPSPRFLDKNVIWQNHPKVITPTTRKGLERLMQAPAVRHPHARGPALCPQTDGGRLWSTWAAHGNISTQWTQHAYDSR